MMVAFYIGCGLSLAATAFAPDPLWLAAGMFMLGVFAAIYHPVGMAMLIEASGAKGRTLGLQRRMRNLGVSLAAGISAALATWISWRAAFLAPAVICVATGIVYYWLTPDDRHHAKTRQSKPAVPLTPKLIVMLFGLFLVIALSSGLVFNVLTIALPKIVDERHGRLGAAGPGRQHRDRGAGVRRGGAARGWPAGRTNSALRYLCRGDGARICRQPVGDLCHRLSADGRARARHRGDLRQVTVNDIILARYTADAWRGRVYAIRYFTLFISAGAAVAIIALLHKSGGFGLVLGVNAIIRADHVPGDARLVSLIISIEARHTAAQAGRIIRTAGGSGPRP